MNIISLTHHIYIMLLGMKKEWGGGGYQIFLFQLARPMEEGWISIKNMARIGTPLLTLL